jgi:adenylosuccinate synthase
VFDIHQIMDRLAEKERGGSSIGTTGKGIGPTYCEKANRSGARFCDLISSSLVKGKLKKIFDAATKRFGDFEYDVEAELANISKHAEFLEPFIIDTVEWLNSQYASGKKIMLEGANAAMLDLDFGTYPYVTSSNPTIGGAITGSGLEPKKIGEGFAAIFLFDGLC